MTSLSIVANVSSIPFLTSDLSGHNISSAPVHIEGRFHSSALVSSLSKINELCTNDRDLQFPPGERALAPIRSNVNGEIVTKGSLHSIALQSILTEVSNWHATLSAAVSEVPDSSVAVLGFADAIHQSILRSSGCSLTKVSSLPSVPLTPNPSSPASESLHGFLPPSTGRSKYPRNAIAIVGMACKFPGADSLEEFWDNIRAGASFAEEVPESRFAIHGHRRTMDSKARFWGNFIRDPDAFDQRFFKKSSREAVQTDPQQRLLLQCAYQAIESSGYFSENEESRADDIGCFVGACANDYNDNIASHPPTAFSSLGTLRAFLSGKISHYFGWTGPSVTYDTACSSSLVAIHQACKAIELGECSRAVAGGVNVLTNPYFYQNLKAGGFLSPTGPTKAFDAKADGYCRGEGVGLVVLKKLSAAVADQDHVLGVISGSAVNQNSNSSAITVPSSQSQVALYQKVSSMSGVDPTDISFVEAHGTGTPVGDPLESASVIEVFGSPDRTSTLHLGSVKGNVGHTEAASGAAALIKTVLMMQHEEIPRQANFVSLNPKIEGLAANHMAVPTTSTQWDADFRVACVNNYGASGSNAAAIVAQAPNVTKQKHGALSRYPFMISAHSVESLEEYKKALLEKWASVPLSDLAYNLAIKQNLAFPNIITTTITDDTKLEAQVSACDLVEVPSKPKPLVLAFGGQESAVASVSKEIYAGSALLRSHLDRCDQVLRSAGFDSLYPGIFDTSAEQDVVRLHSKLFALQYSTAKSWLDSGARVQAVMGHSFGQLTALCVSGCLALEDGLRLVVGRALLMQKHWGPESGSMIALEAEPETAEKIAAECDAEVACYNGPTSQVLVGSKSTIENIGGVAASRSLKHKALSVTNGFHSKFTEPLLPGLEKLAEQLTFNEPEIALETCSNAKSWGLPEPRRIVEHTRTPVYFNQAVQRISDRLGPCTWLEAGSATSVTAMVRRALGSTASREHDFLPLQLGAQEASGVLADTTTSLWKLGHKVQFWPFHRSQKDEYSYINLPPYQFQKTRHWLEFIDHAAAEVPPEIVPFAEADVPLVSLIEKSKGEGKFSINPKSKPYKLFVQGHAVLGAPLCPAPLYVELVAQGAMQLEDLTDLVPRVENLEIQAPLGYDVDRKIVLRIASLGSSPFAKTFVVESRGVEDKGDAFITHATGRVILRKPDNPEIRDPFLRYQRLVGPAKCDAVSHDPEAEQIRGSMVYKVFSKVVSYAGHYKGVKNVTAKENEVTAQIKMPDPEHKSDFGETICHPMTIDNAIQVAGLHVNCFSPCLDNEVYVSTKVDLVQPSHEFLTADHDHQEWTVFSSFSRISDKEVVNDIFVYDNTSHNLVMMVLGARFTKVLITSLARVLNRANASHESSKENSMVPTPARSRASTLTRKLQEASTPSVPTPKRRRPEPRGVFPEVQDLLSKAVEIPSTTIKPESTPDELGIDSLMVTELLSDIKEAFSVEIPSDDFVAMLDVGALCDHLNSRTGGENIESSGTSTERSSSPDQNDTGTPETEVSESPAPLGCLVSDLAKLVCEHLETTVAFTQDTSLADQGMDSLIGVELLNDIEKIFGTRVQMEDMTMESTFGDLCHLALPKQPTPKAPARSGSPKAAHKTQERQSDRTEKGSKVATLGNAQQAFEAVRYDYEDYAKEEGFSTFWSDCYPLQARLVLAYTVEAFASLNCPLEKMAPGEKLPLIQHQDKHKLLVNQLYEILIEGSLVSRNEDSFVRAAKSVDRTPSDDLLSQILHSFPQHASEHKLLHITGSRLADCLIGKADPLQLLFRSKENRNLLEDVYTNGPMYAAITKHLGSFFEKALANADGKVNILELGGGTGGTTKAILERLTRLGVDFTYTFTDLSGSLVNAAKKKFAGYSNIEYKVIDITKEPAQDVLGKYHTILSTNCIHATENLEVSTSNILKMLRPDGFLCLVEFTRNMFWFDLVFGLLDGWWFFKDGRKHVLASTDFWDSSMKRAGFKHVTWTCGDVPEANTLRIITGFAEPNKLESREPKLDAETIEFKKTEDVSLCADIYYLPPSEMMKRKSWPIGTKHSFFV